MQFQWDKAKERENIKKHKVNFSEAVSTFSDPRGLAFNDEGHSHAERRFYHVGKSNTGRILTTYYTERGQTIRIIGCAEWRKFRRLYYETTKIE